MCLPATPVLARYEPEPGGDLTAMATVMSMAQGGHQRYRVQWPNAVHFPQALTHVQIAADVCEPWRHLCNGRIEARLLVGATDGVSYRPFDKADTSAADSARHSRCSAPFAGNS